MSSSTAFGASWDHTPNMAVGVLRAQASATLNLLPVDVADAAACVAAAHVWAQVTRSSSLLHASRQCAESIASAASILARAAGHKHGVSSQAPVPEVELSLVTSLVLVEHSVAASLKWLRSQLGHDPSSLRTATLAAAQDLCVAPLPSSAQAQSLNYAAVLFGAEAEQL